MLLFIRLSLMVGLNFGVLISWNPVSSLYMSLIILPLWVLSVCNGRLKNDLVVGLLAFGLPLCLFLLVGCCFIVLFHCVFRNYVRRGSGWLRAGIVNSRRRSGVILTSVDESIVEFVCWCSLMYSCRFMTAHDATSIGKANCFGSHDIAKIRLYTSTGPIFI